MQRREFVKTCSAALAGTALGSSVAAQSEQFAGRSFSIRRWRGFNLTELTGGQRGQRFKELDFDWMAEWGFDFARLPMSYWAWADSEAG